MRAPVDAPLPTAQATGIATAIALTRRELVRIARQPSRLIAAVATPVLIWVLLASGFARSFRAPLESASGESPDYALYLLPGMLTMTVLFSSIFGAMSLIEDRNAGFLQSALVSPAPRWAIAASKLLGSSLVATAQAAVLLPAALILGRNVGPVAIVLCLLGLLCVSLGISGLGLAAAWWVDSVQGFHGVMNLVLMPMWLLSGSLFPLEGASGWMRMVMMANPVTWTTRALHAALGLGGGYETAAWTVSVLFACVGVLLGWLTLGRGVRRL